MRHVPYNHVGTTVGDVHFQIRPQVGHMIDVKQAVANAKEFAQTTLGGKHSDYSLEEFERDTYKGREVWLITLGMPRNVAEPAIPALGDRLGALLGPADREYKTFAVDADSGEVLAMKLRVLAGT